MFIHFLIAGRIIYFNKSVYCCTFSMRVQPFILLPNIVDMEFSTSL